VKVTGQPIYDAPHGRTVVLGRVGNVSQPDLSRVIETRQYTSALPLETCMPGVDADHDGEVDCDDQDCWWACAPACPPLATCAQL
jgi:hypothetical protein